MLANILKGASAAQDLGINYISYSYAVQLDGATVTGNAPSGAQAGDLLIAFSTQSGSTTSRTMTPPSGWTEILDANGRWFGYLPSYDGTTASWDFTKSNSTANPAIVIVCFRNAAYDSNSGLGAAGDTSSTVSLSQNDSVIVAFYATLNNLSGAGIDGPTTPSDFLPILGSGVETNQSSLVSYYRGGFSSGSQTITNTNVSGNNRGYLVGLKPA